MSNSKFLYGDKQKLANFLEGKQSPRFSDLSHYSRLENNLMRDDEMNKKFLLQRNYFELTINGVTIPQIDFSSDPLVEIIPRHCYCLCLSNKKNDPELFEKFKANICVEIDTDILIDFLTQSLNFHLPNTKLIARDIQYYDYETNIKTFDFLNPDNAVFFKPTFFKHEAEFRIALFYPLNKTGFKMLDGSFIPFYRKGTSQHIQFDSNGKQAIEFIKDSIINVVSP